MWLWSIEVSNIRVALIDRSVQHVCRFDRSKCRTCVSLWSIEVSNKRVALIDRSVQQTCRFDRSKCPTNVSLWRIGAQHTWHLNHDRPCCSCDVWLPASYYQDLGSITGPTIWDLYRTSWDTVLSEFFGFTCHCLTAKAPYSFISHPCVGKWNRKTPQYHSMSHRVTKITTNKTLICSSLFEHGSDSRSAKGVCGCAVAGVREEWQFLENTQGTSNLLRGRGIDWTNTAIIIIILIITLCTVFTTIYPKSPCIEGTNSVAAALYLQFVLYVM